MKNYKWMMASLLGGAMLLAASCVEEKNVETGGIPGTKIVFAAMTSYENSDDTRTEYSGVLYGTTDKVERIDWVANTDKFTVNYAAGTSFTTADYLVTSVNAENYNSKAGVTEANKNEILAWAEGSEHKFYAMYPPHSVNTTASLTNVNHFQATLPAAQPQTHTQNVTVGTKTWSRMLPNMNNAYMVAYAGTDNGMVTGGGVTLPFRPAVTTFEFRLRRNEGEDGKNIRYFKLISEGHALTGQFSFDITGGDGRGGFWGESDGVTVETKTDANSVITVDFGETGVALPAHNSTSYLDFTIFAVPKNLNDLKIQLIDVDETIRELPLKDKGSDGNFSTYHSFTGAKKYVITNSTVPGEWEYVIETSDDIVTYGHMPVSDLPFTVKSYKHSGSTVIPVPWTLQYSIDGGSTWADFNASTKRTAEYSGTDPSPIDWHISFESDILGGLGTGNLTDVNPGVLDLLGTSDGKIQGDEVAAAQRAKLASHDPRGTMANPFDLSKHPVYGDIDNDVPQTTANSYVISAPGVYMFPCVYGNGLTEDHENISAYWPGNADDSYSGVIGDNRSSNLKEVNVDHNNDASYWRAYTPRFYNAINDEIDSPYIFEDLDITSPSAIVVWQDTDEDNGDFKHQIIPFSSDYVGLTDKTVGGKTVKYIWFKIDADRIKAGNFVLALRGKAGHLTSPEILWSWHIWITPDDLTPDVVTNTSGTYGLMPKNMGWFDSDKGSVSQWPIRGMKFRAVQTESYGKDASNNPLYKDDTFTVTQIGDADETSPTVGGNVYYQWGRKDPFLPVAPDGSNHPVVYNSLFEDRIELTTNGIKEKNLGSTYLDYGASIREPYSPFKNEASINYIGGPVYPYKQVGTTETTWSFNSDDSRRHFFTLAQAANIETTPFCDHADWKYFEDGYLYHNNREWYWGPYTNVEAQVMLANGFTEDDFTGSPDNWMLKSWKVGPFTQTQAEMLCNTRYNTLGLNYWLVPSAGSLADYCYLDEDVSFNLGPYNQAEATILMQNGYDPTGVDFYTTSTPVGGGPYPASMRSKAANVTNLWNNYHYDEEPSGSSYTNKFKTIYDPCPPGFTVPVKQVFIGSRTFSDMDRWTSPINRMHMKVSSASDVFAGMSPQLVNGVAGNPEKKGLQLSGGIFLPYTGARIFRAVGGENLLHAEGMGSAGYYWTDSPLRMDWRHTRNSSSPTYNPEYDTDAWHNETVLEHLWFYFDAFGLIFGSDADYDQYINNSYRVQSYTRATAFSVRPMKDPKVTSY